MGLKNIRSNIRDLMEQKNWSQADLSRASGVLKVSISNILNGKTAPTLVTVEKIANALDTTVDYLSNHISATEWDEEIRRRNELIDSSSEPERFWDAQFDPLELESLRTKTQPEETNFFGINPGELSYLLKRLSNIPQAELEEFIKTRLQAQLHSSRTPPRKDRSNPSELDERSGGSSMSPEQKALVDLVLKLEPRDIKTFTRLVRRRLMGYSRKKQELG